MKSICSECKRPTNHKTLYKKSVDIVEEDTGWWESHVYEIIQCDGCDSISFRKLYTDVADDQHAEAGVSPWTQEVYPRRTLTTLPIKSLFITPSNIKKIYRESIDAFNNDIYILCTAGLRAIIEGVCNDKGIKGGTISNKAGKKIFSKNLDGKIEGLVENGYLTKSNAEVLHELRFLGNEAIHDLSTPAVKELQLAINIIEHSLENVYELQHKGKVLRREIAKRKVKSVTKK